MSDGGSGAPGPQDPGLDAPPEVFVSRLEPHERTLVHLKDKLYEGSWERVLADLRARLTGQPYVFKLSHLIARDVAAIERMQEYEARHGVELSQLLEKSIS